MEMVTEKTKPKAAANLLGGEKIGFGVNPIVLAIDFPMIANGAGSFVNALKAKSMARKNASPAD